MRADDDRFSREPRRERRPRRPRARLPRDTARSIKEFARSRTGVEAYVEPRTLDQQLSVVLVATDGEWQRFELPDERLLVKLGRKRPLPIYEVSRVGYPKRMREYRRGQD
jgi:hypothetical protein